MSGLVIIISNIKIIEEKNIYLLDFRRYLANVPRGTFKHKIQVSIIKAAIQDDFEKVKNNAHNWINNIKCMNIFEYLSQMFHVEHWFIIEGVT